MWGFDRSPPLPDPRTHHSAKSQARRSEWVRERMLLRLLPISADDLVDTGPAGRRAVVRRLLSALRGERARGRAGHWSYSLDRHVALARALAEERQALAEVEAGLRRHGPPATKATVLPENTTAADR